MPKVRLIFYTRILFTPFRASSGVKRERNFLCFYMKRNYGAVLRVAVGENASFQITFHSFEKNIDNFRVVVLGKFSIGFILFRSGVTADIRSFFSIFFVFMMMAVMMVKFKRMRKSMV